jgi:hypothetical protein
MKSLLRFLRIASSPLTHIFNQVLPSGTFPTCLKYSIVIPVYKKGDKQDISSYRPISLLTSFSKILEKIIDIRLYKHVTENNILSVEHLGFMENSSMETATYKLLKEILHSFNEKKFTGGIFCDLKKAFDNVGHNILLHKLVFYGITGSFYNLIQYYLEHRYQRVQVGRKFNDNIAHSEWERITHGVPQGSILGPLLFLLCINDFPKVLNSISLPVLFADDPSLIIMNKNTMNFQNKISIIFDKLNKWFAANQLALNYGKTKFIQFNTSNSNNVDIPINHGSKTMRTTNNTNF